MNKKNSISNTHLAQELVHTLTIWIMLSADTLIGDTCSDVSFPICILLRSWFGMWFCFNFSFHPEHIPR